LSADQSRPSADQSQPKRLLLTTPAWIGRSLAVLITNYPRRLTELELARQLARGEPTLAEKDEVAFAVEELELAGLVRRSETLLVLTGTATYLAGLERN
jgi:hypothetical protein